MGKSTISMAIFNSYVKLPEGMCLLLFFVSIIQLGSLACNLKHPHSGSKYVVSSPTKPCFLGGV